MENFIANFVVILSLIRTGLCVCHFPTEMLGNYVMQTEGHVSDVSLEADALHPWGKCHLRRGPLLILRDRMGDEDCMRCLHLTLKAPNVIQIHTEGLGKCYTREETARSTCPDERAIHERRFQEIMLYRKPGEQLATFCPISGKFRFTYTAAGGDFRCDQTLSDLSNCPAGHTIGARFTHCNFPDMEVTFRCLGDWEGARHDRYLALLDLRASDQPRFRCGLYNVNPLTGRAFVSLSADSSCHNQLRSATDGFESLILTPFPEKSPARLESRCRFPDWVQGAWEGGLTGSHDRLQHHTRTTRITLTCLRENADDSYSVFLADHCGEESYTCLKLKRRSANVVEFQIGSQLSPIFTEELCQDEEQFNEYLWNTRGRVRGALSPCPITGDYSGVLPENPELCAKVASDCNNPDVMFYTVANCKNRTQVFEEREYRCLGSWDDPVSGLTFTYTQRKDMDGLQCFSGKVVSGGREAYIKEAGHTSCERGEDPLAYGMRITRHATCPEGGPSGSVVPRYPTVGPEVFYSPLPNDPFWYHKAEAQPTNSLTDEEVPVDGAQELILSSPLLIMLLQTILLRLMH